MGSCVSFSRSPAAASAAEAESSSSPRSPAATARVVNMDGSMAQFVVPTTAREALMALGDDSGRQRATPAGFLCSADELRFDTPPRALAADEAFRPGQLYFVLPAPMLRRPLSGDDMAALAVRAATALAAEAGLAATGGVMSSPQRQKKQAGGAAGKGRRWRQSAARVAPLLVVSSSMDNGRSDGSWNSDTHGGGRTRNGQGSSVRRQPDSWKDEAGSWLQERCPPSSSRRAEVKRHRRRRGVIRCLGYFDPCRVSSAGASYGSS